MDVPWARDERTGAECVFWERALPVISNRDYVFSRRTWKETTSDGQTVYWAINKGCTHSQTPETPKVKRVDPYFSSWRMRAVPGKDGRLTSAECLLSHFEEQHVNQDVARFAVKCGMWGVVKNMDGGFRKFQRERAAAATAAAARASARTSRASRDGGSRRTSRDGGSRGGGVGSGSSVSGGGGAAAGSTGGGDGGGGGGKGLQKFRKIALGGVLSAIGALAAMEANNKRGGGGESSRGGGRDSKHGVRRRHGHHGVNASDVGAVVDPKISVSVGGGDGGGHASAAQNWQHAAAASKFQSD